MTIRAKDLVNLRETTAFGTARSGQKIYRGLPPEVTDLQFSSDAEIKLYFYSRQGKRLGEISSEHYGRTLNSVDFTLVEQGCGSATISLSSLPTFPLELGQYVDIHVYQDIVPWYSGVVMKAPAVGALADDAVFEIELFGFYQFLDKVVLKSDATRRTAFGHTNVTTVAYEVAVGFIAPKIGATINPSKIDPQTDYIANELDFELSTAKEALEDLADLAQDYIVGVDSRREFFFRKRRSKALSLGDMFPTHHLSLVDVVNDMDDVFNRVYVKSGKIEELGDTDGSIFSVFQDSDSQRMYGVLEASEDTPTLVSTVDVERWGKWFIEQHREPLQRMKVKVTNIGTQVLIPGDFIRVNTSPNTVNYSDEFEDSSMDVFWTQVQTHGAVYSETTTVGFMTVVPGSGTSSSSPYGVPLLYKRVAGDFRVDTSLAGFSGTVEYMTGDAAGLHVRWNGDNWLEFVRRRITNAPPAWSIERRDTTVGSTSITAVASVGFDPVVFRMERIDGEVRTWYGPNINSLVPVSAPTFPFSSSRPLLAGITAYSEGQVYASDSATHYYYFDYFRVSPFGLYYDLPIKKVKYEASEGMISAEVELGEFETPFVAEVKRLKDDSRKERIKREITIRHFNLRNRAMTRFRRR